MIELKNTETTNINSFILTKQIYVFSSFERYIYWFCFKTTIPNKFVFQISDKAFLILLRASVKVS